jgi:hypothetical protein
MQEKAFEDDQKYKEGKFILERVLLSEVITAKQQSVAL